MATCIILARGGSTRIVNKNRQMLGDKTLVEHAIDKAFDAGLFPVIVSSDDLIILDIAFEAGALPMYNGWHSDTSIEQDILRHDLQNINDVVVQLRCTSPFLSVETIKKGLLMVESPGHPTWYPTQATGVKTVKALPYDVYKIWGAYPDIMPMFPLVYPSEEGSFTRQSNTNKKVEVFVQTGGMDIFFSKNLACSPSHLGPRICPLIVEGDEALDINTPADMEEAIRVYTEQNAICTYRRDQEEGSPEKSSE